MIVSTVFDAGLTALPVFISLALMFVLVGFVTLLKPLVFGSAVEVFISSIVNTYLRWRYPIHHTHDGSTIPGTKYQWPDGQGDVGKYILGRKNGEEWHNKYGDVYRLWAGMTPEIVVCRPDQLSAVFKDSDRHSKAINGDSGWLMSRILGKCLGLMSGSQWKTLKGIAAPPFRHAAAVASIDRVKVQVSDHFRQLENNGNLAHGLIHPVQDLKMLPFFIVADVIYGELSLKLAQGLKRLAPARENLFKHVVFGGLPRFSISRFLPTAANQELKAFKEEWRRFNAEAYQEGREKKRDTLVHQMFEAADRGELSSEQIHQTLDEMLYANLDVTTGGLSWNLVFLAANQDAQARLRDEIDKLHSDEEEKAYVSKSDTYLAACIMESSRLRPALPFSIPQSAPTERIIDGYVIPKDTNFIVDTWALNVRSDFWAPDNTSYRPDRFFASNTAERRYHFWRFGFGPRQCIGKYTADVVIRVILLHLFKNYNLEPLEAADWAKDPECWITHPDLQVRCTPRTPKN